MQDFLDQLQAGASCWANYTPSTPNKNGNALWFIENRCDKPAYLAARRKSDCQSDLHLAVHHGNSQRADKNPMSAIRPF